MDTLLAIEYLEKIGFSALFGAIMGLEREWSGKSAGFRTMMLVCLGATVFTMVSYQMALLDDSNGSDFTRVASNIVTGIGFLGAGLIFKGDHGVQGLTTAATVWAAAAIGMAVGIGSFWLAGASTVAVWLILVVLHHVEWVFETMLETRKYHVYFDPDQSGLLRYEEFFDGGFRLLEKKYHKSHGKSRISWTVRAKKIKHDVVVEKMLKDARILELSY